VPPYGYTSNVQRQSAGMSKIKNGTLGLYGKV